MKKQNKINKYLKKNTKIFISLYKDNCLNS